MPEIQAAYEQLEPHGLVSLAVSLDEPAEDAAGLAALNGATFLIASDPNRTDTGTAYAIAYFPTHILIDRDGIVRDVVIAALDQEQIIAQAQQLQLTGERAIAVGRR
jgi:peroxiredoxin